MFMRSVFLTVIILPLVGQSKAWNVVVVLAFFNLFAHKPLGEHASGFEHSTNKLILPFINFKSRIF